MAILRFKLVNDAPIDGQATQLVHIDGLSTASGGGTTITDVTVNMLDSDGTASGSVSGTTLVLNVPRGLTGTAATVEVGTVTSGDTAAVTNSGTSTAARLNFTIPKGDKGDAGTAATISVGSVTSGDTASVTNSGSDSAAMLDFVLPKGDTGATGVGVASISLTVTNGVVTAGTWTDTDDGSHAIEVSTASS